MLISRYKNISAVLIIDALLICLSLYFSHLIRFDFQVEKNAHAICLEILPYVLIIKLVCFWAMDLYKGMWRYTSINSLLDVVKAVAGSAGLVVIYVLCRYRVQGISRTVFFIDFCLTLIFIMGFRVSIRICYEQVVQKITIKGLIDYLNNRLKNKRKPVKKVLIIGAGDCAEKIFREIKDNAKVQYKVVGFLDDDPLKIGRKIHGISVAARIEELEKVARFLEASEVIIALPTVSAKRMREIIKVCKDSGIKFKTVPGMGELINGKVSVNAIRKVEYRDLLGRQPIDLDTEKIGGYLSGKIVFVTGAGGSIGTELCRQICRFSPKKIVLFERAESPLYEIDLELKKNFPAIEVIPILGDIQHKEDLSKVFGLIKPEIVFHAAAYKHVPMLENHPWKAVENNIAGTENLVETADKFCCKKFIFISTDKAVNPTNFMGASKRIAEMIVQNRNLIDKSKTQFVTVRFGNVIGSVGSVIPLFKKQIKEGGPVTVTHPDIIRYFMLILVACQLILQAGGMGKGGEIFILEMGDPIKIDNMARDLIKFSGFEPDVDIKIDYTGLRPGEKLYEELMTNQEDVVPTNHNKIMVLNG
ncbi:MAG: polysaccharide biosynthesis protein, partial [Deltaproteobacteria bacterium]|nr:polysaccharide biosynthesis protein [Deltaproteobacteria bacterium]